MHLITPSPLTKAAFAPFGDVIATDGAMPVEINQGFATRFNHLASIDVTSGGAPVNISLFDARPRPQPIDIKMMERHPLGSQLFAQRLEGRDQRVIRLGQRRARPAPRPRRRDRSHRTAFAQPVPPRARVA